MDTIMITPVIIPPVEPSTCPECGKPENIVRKCAHCGHHYQDEPTEWYIPILGTGLIVGFIWLVITLITWLFGFDGDSLWEVLKSQWEWFTSLRIW